MPLVSNNNHVFHNDDSNCQLLYKTTAHHIKSSHNQLSVPNPVTLSLLYHCMTFPRHILWSPPLTKLYFDKAGIKYIDQYCRKPWAWALSQTPVCYMSRRGYPFLVVALDINLWKL